ncbi:hypothetical protein R3X25_09855 [Lutibacter sp. TH_r2]|uniref:hypothetical protein n=1 Tax=Lutibacter sp. TH_r2 TaxID=3082083 RepID=UPI0029548752|nr:hypothetical protein [Lutibacter sp. TH_r2]MDV7187584.1 hypothetical protein [Lutibacter sp. TH_r2]
MTFEINGFPQEKLKKELKGKQRIYINTLIPNFNLNGEIINKHNRNNFCVKL